MADLEDLERRIVELEYENERKDVAIRRMESRLVMLEARPTETRREAPTNVR